MSSCIDNNYVLNCFGIRGKQRTRPVYIAMLFLIYVLYFHHIKSSQVTCNKSFINSVQSSSCSSECVITVVTSQGFICQTE